MCNPPPPYFVQILLTHAALCKMILVNPTISSKNLHILYQCTCVDRNLLPLTPFCESDQTGTFLRYIRNNTHSQRVQNQHHYTMQKCFLYSNYLVKQSMENSLKHGYIHTQAGPCTHVHLTAKIPSSWLVCINYNFICLKIGKR